MKLTKTKLTQIIKEELNKMLKESEWSQEVATTEKTRPYEDDPFFQHEIDKDSPLYTPGGEKGLPPPELEIPIEEIPKYLEDAGYMIVPADYFQMSDDEKADYEAAAERGHAWDFTKGDSKSWTGGMGRLTSAPGSRWARDLPGQED